MEGQYYKLYDFISANVHVDGTTPLTSLTSDGVYLYGTTSAGGAFSDGTIFKILPDGTGFMKLHDFIAIASVPAPYPTSLYYEGNVLFGFTERGGTSGLGEFFKINTDGTGYTPLHAFNSSINGFYPAGTVVSDGMYFYGLCGGGGLYGKGMLYKIKNDGSNFTSVYDFNGTDGSYPTKSLLYDGSFLYGTTAFGGINDSGTVFKIKLNGTGFAKLFDFDGETFGKWPNGALITDGNYLFGITFGGGINHQGTVFKIKTDGTGFSKLIDFSGVNGSLPFGPLVLEGGYLYGVTQTGTGNNYYGTVFKIKTDGTDFNILISFNPTTQGSFPECSLISDGVDLFGTTRNGGSLFTSYGSIFKIGLYTSIDEKTAQNNLITISPNPTNSMLSINSTVEFRSIKIVNPIGQTIAVIENKSNTISVSDLSSGIYFIQLLDKKGNLLKTEKFIKE